MVAVDSLDRSILAVLRDSGRAPFVDIASKVGVTERTVRTRMKRLEEDGVIRGYTCLLYTSPSPRDVEESRMPSSA